MKWGMVLMSIVCSLGTIAQLPYDIVITELMADPTPQVGLPANEWIEIKNRSAVPIQLQGFRLGDASGWSGVFPSYLLQPDSILIICASSAYSSLSAFGTALAITGFPSLDNNGELLVLRSADGRTIHAINYQLSWYKNALKQEGGWCLEIIDPDTPCTGASNWTASTSPAGGTPGKTNSVNGISEDNSPPKLLHSFTRDSTGIVLVFDESLDSLAAANPSNYSLSGGIQINLVETIPPLFDQVLLQLSIPLSPSTIYTLSARNLEDCKGNRISNAQTITAGTPSSPVAGEILVNEILFNPRPGSYDYVEVINSSNKIFDLQKLYIANRNISGDISSIRQCSTTPRYIFPGEYRVFTENADELAMHYLVSHPESVMQISSFPSYPDDKGTVVLLSDQGNIIDEVSYDKDWHFKLITNPEGISLERISTNRDSNLPSNWHSAASTAGYGTPGYVNSQTNTLSGTGGKFEVQPAVFSPDNDGRDDIASFSYYLENAGYVANVTLFNIAGRPVKQLVRNGLLGAKGMWTWDGLGDKGEKLPTGIYIAVAEFFNLEGKREQFRATVVLAGR